MNKLNTHILFLLILYETLKQGTVKQELNVLGILKFHLPGN